MYPAHFTPAVTTIVDFDRDPDQAKHTSRLERIRVFPPAEERWEAVLMMFQIMSQLKCRGRNYQIELVDETGFPPLASEA